MSMDRIWAIEKFTFDGVTYDEDQGGPLDWDWDDSSNEIPDRVAGQIYPSAVLLPEGDVQVSITMRDPYIAIDKGTKSDLAFTFKKDDGSSDEPITFKDLVFIGQRAGGQKSIPGQSTLLFRYEGTGTGRVVR